MEVCFSVGIHIQWLLTFQSAFRDVLSSQNMSESFVNVYSVGAVSSVTSKLVVRQSRSYSVSTATSELFEVLGETQKAEAKGYSYTVGKQRIVRA